MASNQFISRSGQKSFLSDDGQGVLISKGLRLTLDSDISYSKGDIVEHNNSLWKANSDISTMSSGVVEGADSDQWTQISGGVSAPNTLEDLSNIGFANSDTIPRGSALRCFDGVNWVLDAYESGSIRLSTNSIYEYQDPYGLSWGYWDGSLQQPFVRNVTNSNMAWLIDVTRKYADNSSVEETRQYEGTVAPNEFFYFFSDNDFDATGDALYGTIRFISSTANISYGFYYEIKFFGVIDAESTRHKLRFFFRRLR